MGINKNKPVGCHVGIQVHLYLLNKKAITLKIIWKSVYKKGTQQQPMKSTVMTHDPKYFVLAL